jgi:hypothetical protein
MGTYQGKALQARAPRRRGVGRKRLVIRIMLLGLVAVAVAHVPWAALSRRWAVIGRLDVEGVRYLDPSHVQEASGLKSGDPLWSVDLKRARQALLLDSRIAGATVTRRFPRGIRIMVHERVPALLVNHGTPWELDSAGVLLAPLERGVVADVPLLVGADFEGVPAGTQISSSRVTRGHARRPDAAARRAGLRARRLARSDHHAHAARRHPRRRRGMAPFGAHAVGAARRARRLEAERHVGRRSRRALRKPSDRSTPRAERCRGSSGMSGAVVRRRVFEHRR